MKKKILFLNFWHILILSFLDTIWLGRGPMSIIFQSCKKEHIILEKCMVNLMHLIGKNYWTGYKKH